MKSDDEVRTLCRPVKFLHTKLTYVFMDLALCTAGKMGKRKDLSEFDEGQIVMARPLDQSISKTAALVWCSRSAVVSIYQKYPLNPLSPVSCEMGPMEDLLLTSLWQIPQQTFRDLVESMARQPTSEDDLCPICYAHSISAIFKPCSHKSCKACINQHLMNNKDCFFCKATITGVEDYSKPAGS
ncbi:hypothetical protein QTP70_015642 [Hemibagrus guttatus]|uniref:RING-type E3 ubiquitin transferase n=1 Tax=Hemibagrus guttatus TaxID=175788 RepID=A0AAE0Q2Z3_9TELE|nr:hypothetical protein QTP70_015642 [Hemibagrus guttatus]